MTLRRGGGGRKRDKALGDFISADLARLNYLAPYLNGDDQIHARADGTRPELGEVGQADRSLVDAATRVVDEVLRSPFSVVSTEAATLFNRLAAGAALHFVADADGAVRPGDGFRLNFSDREYLQWVSLETPTARGVWTAWLAYFLDNPQRERLRRCQQCHRWFVDGTRNRSARRCSRACTIAWSNAQRVPTAAPPARRSARKGRR